MAGANILFRRMFLEIIKSLKGTFCISIEENTHCQLSIQMSIMFSVIFLLKPAFHSGISLVTGEIFVSENQKN